MGRRRAVVMATEEAGLALCVERLRSVCTENLNMDVLVMESPEDRVRPNASGGLNGSRDRCILSQGPVGSEVVVIASMGSQDSAQMQRICSLSSSPRACRMRRRER